MAAEIRARTRLRVDLLPGDRGAFEVRLDGRRIFSKLESGRFPDLEEILAELG